LRSKTFATAQEPFIARGTFHKVRNLTTAEPMKTPSRGIFSRKDRAIAAAAVLTLLAFMLCHATYAQQTSPDQTQNIPDPTQKSPPPPPDAKPAGDPKTGVLHPPDVDPKMAKQVPDLDPGMTQPPPAKPDKQPPPADQPPPKVQPK
jgi:hypothetical protein